MTRTTRTAVLLAAVVSAACSKPATPSASSAVAPRTSGAEKERADVPTVAPVSRDGVRYEAIVWGRARGLAQNGGYVAAVDEKTGSERWVAKVYDALPDDGKEQDKRDVFITALKFDAEPQYLLITNERNAVFRLNIVTRAVSSAKR
ncbi:MAG TPA: hypothetical protein VIP11_10785 [Gemmatimonadaceae bacterium]